MASGVKLCLEVCLGFIGPLAVLTLVMGCRAKSVLSRLHCLLSMVIFVIFSSLGYLHAAFLYANKIHPFVCRVTSFIIKVFPVQWVIFRQ